MKQKEKKRKLRLSLHGSWITCPFLTLYGGVKPLAFAASNKRREDPHPAFKRRMISSSFFDV